MQITKAVRRALPMQLAMFAPSGGGKTMSALLMAAGMAPNGKVCVIDTERGRASLYADNRRVLSALPNGYDVLEIDQPYHPRTFIEGIDTVESAGYKVCIIDSGSDSWDGPGGCSDIAEKDKAWNGAKKWNKRMMTRASLSDMHIIWLLKAQEKTKVIDKKKSESGKQEYVGVGMQAIWEKNNLFPQLIVLSIDPVTHMATAVKCHDDLWQYFQEPHLITKQDGENLRRWNESGQAVDQHSQLRQRARVAATDGLKAYQAFYASLPPDQKKVIFDTDHEANKVRAEQADAEAALSGQEEPPEHFGEQPNGTLFVPTGSAA